MGTGGPVEERCTRETVVPEEGGERSQPLYDDPEDLSRTLRG